MLQEFPRQQETTFPFHTPFFYHATPATLGEFSWFCTTNFTTVSALQLQSSGTAVPRRRLIYEVQRTETEFLQSGRADEGRDSTMETLTEWKEPLCASQGTTAAHSHSEALKLGKTGRLCVCVAVERSVDLWLREYFQPLCWMMNYQHTRKDFSCMSVTFRRTVASSPCLDSSLFLRSWKSCSMIQCFIHLAGTPQSYYPAFFESPLHNDVSQQGTGTWLRPPYSFCWNDLLFGSRQWQQTHIV